MKIRVIKRYLYDVDKIEEGLKPVVGEESLMINRNEGLYHMKTSFFIRLYACRSMCRSLGCADQLHT